MNVARRLQLTDYLLVEPGSLYSVVLGSFAGVPVMSAISWRVGNCFLGVPLCDRRFNKFVFF